MIILLLLYRKQQEKKKFPNKSRLEERARRTKGVKKSEKLRNTRKYALNERIE